jgi:hypothetical protein
MTVEIGEPTGSEKNTSQGAPAGRDELVIVAFFSISGLALSLCLALLFIAASASLGFD